MKKFSSLAAKLALLIGTLSALALALQGPGYQAGWWGLGFSFFKVFKYVVYTGGIAAILGLIGIIGSRSAGRKTFFMGALGLTLGLATAAVPIQMRKIGQSVPPIHDITTDISNPPGFIAIAPLRADAPNPISYDPEVSKQQTEAFPNIKTIRSQASQQDAFKATQKALSGMGLEIVSADVNSGRVEATETTTWFGFKDDVVVRLSSDAEGTLIDVRSKSRVGRSDLGLNAKRIRQFRSELLSILGEE